jgi:hypothetical protein
LEAVLTTDLLFGNHVFLSAEYCLAAEAVHTKTRSFFIHVVLYSNEK